MNCGAQRGVRALLKGVKQAGAACAVRALRHRQHTQTAHKLDVNHQTILQSSVCNLCDAHVASTTLALCWHSGHASLTLKRLGEGERRRTGSNRTSNALELRNTDALQSKANRRTRTYTRQDGWVRLCKGSKLNVKLNSRRKSSKQPPQVRVAVPGTNIVASESARPSGKP